MNRGFFGWLCILSEVYYGGTATGAEQKSKVGDLNFHKKELNGRIHTRTAKREKYNRMEVEQKKLW